MSEASFEALRNRFPSEIINPFGEVLVIPSKRFQRGWELELEAQGHRVFVTDYKGESCFIVRTNKGESRKNETRQNTKSAKEITTVTKSSKRGVVDHWKRWKPKEVRRLQQMLKEGLDIAAMAEKLDRTEQAVQRKIQRLKRKGFNLPPIESGAVAPPAPSSVTIQKDEDHINVYENLVKELLAVVQLSWPQYPYATRYLLMETSKMIQAK